MRVYLPSDRHQTRLLIQALLGDDLPAYIRVGRNPVEDVYTDAYPDFALDRATLIRDGHDITLIACGEMVHAAKQAGDLLSRRGLSARVLDMHCVKPMDREAVLQAAQQTGGIITVEEHSVYGGMGAAVSQIVAGAHPILVKNLALPDTPVISGTSREVFAHYGLDAGGIAKAAEELMQHR
jgi:transketolase